MIPAPATLDPPAPPPSALLSLKDEDEATIGAPDRHKDVETDEVLAPCPPALPWMLAELPNWGVERVKEMRVEGMDTMLVFPKLMLELLRYKGERIKMWSDSLLAGWESDAGR